MAHSVAGLWMTSKTALQSFDTIEVPSLQSHSNQIAEQRPPLMGRKVMMIISSLHGRMCSTDLYSGHV